MFDREFFRVNKPQIPITPPAPSVVRTFVNDKSVISGRYQRNSTRTDKQETISIREKKGSSTTAQVPPADAVCSCLIYKQSFRFAFHIQSDASKIEWSRCVFENGTPEECVQRRVVGEKKKKTQRAIFAHTSRNVTARRASKQATRYRGSSGPRLIKNKSRKRQRPD
ncbi:unnamed protein product, partial [Iphiclides podalirius]